MNSAMFDYEMEIKDLHDGSPENETMTAFESSVGADEKQSSVTLSEKNISQESSECKINFSDKSKSDFLELEKKFRKMNSPNYLPTVSLDELFDNVYSGRNPIIENLIYSGAYILAGAPKVGKSFLVAQIAYHISMGIDLWEYKVHQGTVLYLALEDDYSRLQNRISKMFGIESTDKLHFATFANKLNDGLEGQLEEFAEEHPDTKLIVIDTLQKIKKSTDVSYSYADDYEIIGKLKEFADKKGICILVVHHTRKQQSGDKFEMISGTTGILGCADGAFVLSKENRTDRKARLDIVGRDQADQRINLIRNEENLTWECESKETELWKNPPDENVIKISEFITENNPEWNGTASELVSILGLKIQPNMFTKILNVQANTMKTDFGIYYDNHRTHNGRSIKLKLISSEV